MRIQAVLFDMDGTLLDTARDFYAILQRMRTEQGLPPMNADTDFREQASRGAQAMVAYAFSLSADSPELEPLKNEFLARYEQQHTQFTVPFPGVLAVLEWLENTGITWGVATNKPLRFAQPIMDALKLSSRCAVLLCPEHVQNSKPAPDMLLAACEQLALEPQQVLYVGDDKRDIDAGRAADMRTVAVRYGYHPADENPSNWGADAVIDSISELTKLLDT